MSRNLVFRYYMDKISALEYFMTSVTLRASSVRRVAAIKRLMAGYGLEFSDSRIFDWLLRRYLRHWRGTGNKSATLRRYNIDGKDYKIRPLYINRVLHGVATQRAMHTGESLSRMLDLAIRVYAKRFIESVLSNHAGVARAVQDVWHKKYLRRRLREPFFISYSSITEENLSGTLSWSARAQYIPKKGLNLFQVLALMRHGA